jgi:hypothetical protein
MNDNGACCDHIEGDCATARHDPEAADCPREQACDEQPFYYMGHGVPLAMFSFDPVVAIRANHRPSLTKKIGFLLGEQEAVGSALR